MKRKNYLTYSYNTCTYSDVHISLTIKVEKVSCQKRHLYLCCLQITNICFFFIFDLLFFSSTHIHNKNIILHTMHTNRHIHTQDNCKTVNIWFVCIRMYKESRFGYNAWPDNVVGTDLDWFFRVFKQVNYCCYWHQYCRHFHCCFSHYCYHCCYFGYYQQQYYHCFLMNPNSI